MDETPFDYANVTGRPTGPVVAALSHLLPGVGFVQEQVLPYARAWREANLTALAQPGPRWIVLGDSMSQGIGAASFDGGWVNQVHDRLVADGHPYAIVNLSASGARVDDVVEHQVPVWRSLPPRAGRNQSRPDLVTVLIGSNDLIRSQNRDALPQRFEQLLRELPSGAVVATLPQPRQAAVQVNEMLARAQAENEIVVAEMREGTKSWRGKLAQDHFHPNELGYADLAGVFYRSISRARSDSAQDQLG